MSKIILSEDKNTGKIQYFNKDENGKIVIETTQNLDDVLNYASSQISSDDGKWNNDMYQVATIPKIIYDKWYKECGSDPTLPENSSFLMSKLNSPEFSQFRTKTGKI